MHTALLIPHDSTKPMEPLDVNTREITSLYQLIGPTCEGLDFINHPQQRVMMAVDDEGLLYDGPLTDIVNIRAWLLDGALKGHQDQIRMMPIVGNVLLLGLDTSGENQDLPQTAYDLAKEAAERALEYEPRLRTLLSAMQSGI